MFKKVNKFIVKIKHYQRKLVMLVFLSYIIRVRLEEQNERVNNPAKTEKTSGKKIIMV